MTRYLLSALLALLAALPATAQTIDVAELDAMFDSEPQVEVNLRGSLLRLAAAATEGSEPETAAMIAGLRGITVRIYPSPPEERSFVVDRLASVADRFEDDGWLTLVRVRSLPNSDEDEGDVWIFVRDDGQMFDGMAVMAVDNDEESAIFVLIDGIIDPADVGALTRRFGSIDIDDYGDADDYEDHE